MDRGSYEPDACFARRPAEPVILPFASVRKSMFLAGSGKKNLPFESRAKSSQSISAGTSNTLRSPPGIPSAIFIAPIASRMPSGR